MDFNEQLRLLQAAHGEPVKLALATVDLAYPELPYNERVEIRQSLKVAAIPHWFDKKILTALREGSKVDFAHLLDRLQGLRIVEQFPARGKAAVNVHEAARLALRKQMASDESSKFRLLSLRAAAYFANNITPAARIEWIYHLLCGNPELGADELEKLQREWSNSARPEDRSALATALIELHDNELVTGRALLWVLITIMWTRVSRGGDAQLAGMGQKTLELARVAGDLNGEAEAQAVLGDVLEAQGNLAGAQAAFEEALGIFRRLVDQDPRMAGWQRDLAVTHSRRGGVLQAQGNLAEAQAAFEEALAISRRLADQDPSMAGWQQRLAVAHSRRGDVLQARGNLADAQAAFEEALGIFRRLVEQDPSNAKWQRDLAVTHNRRGGVLQAQGNLAEAQAAFEEALAISRRLADQDPSHAEWQRGLAKAQSRRGGVLQAQSNLAEAQAAFEEALRISRWLVDQDPGNAGWQRELAVVHNRKGEVLQMQGNLAECRQYYQEACRIMEALAITAPGNLQWTKDRAEFKLNLASCHSAVLRDEK